MMNAINKSVISRAEILESKKGYNQIIKYSPLITKLYPSLFKNVNFRRWPIHIKISRKKHVPSFDLLQQKYSEVSRRLTSELSKEARLNTEEYLIRQEIEKSIMLKFEKNAWVGRRNIDFVFDSIGHVGAEKSNRSMKGLAIEVDGRIHDTIGKTAKDQSKFELLHDLGIGLIVFDAYDAKSKRKIQTQLLPILQDKNFRLSTRDIQRVRTRRHLVTILANCTHAEICNLFEIESKMLMAVTSLASKNVIISSCDRGNQ